jgi:hypothetical protein
MTIKRKQGVHTLILKHISDRGRFLGKRGELLKGKGVNSLRRLNNL